jgi:hypothetical protein
MAAEGKVFALLLTLRQPEVGEGGVFVFYNNPKPFCCSYKIPGNWIDYPKMRRMYRATDAETRARLLFFPPSNFTNIKVRAWLSAPRPWSRKDIRRRLGKIWMLSLFLLNLREPVHGNGEPHRCKETTAC